MFSFPLINLIFYQFLNLNLKSLVILHCWSQKNLQYFAQTSYDLNFYSQYVNLNDSMKQTNLAYRFLRHKKTRIGIFLDMNCKYADATIQQTSGRYFFNQHYHWLTYDHLGNFFKFYKTFQNISLSVDTDLVYVMPNLKNSNTSKDHFSFIVSDVYSNGHLLGGILNVTFNYELQCNESLCFITKYLSALHKRSVYGNRETLRDITIRSAVVVTEFDLNSPAEDINNFLMEEKDFHIDPLARLGFRIFQLIIEMLKVNVRYEYHDRWTDVDFIGGCVGALVSGSADMASCASFITPGRLKFLTPLAATGDFRSVCMFRTPHNTGIHVGVFLEPFSTKVWTVFGVILLVTAILLWLAFRMEYHNISRVQGLSYIPTLLTTCLISFGSACAQASFLVPHSMGGRLIFISLLLVCFIMYNYYTSVVVSTLLGSPIKSKIKTLGDLADSDLDVGLQPLPYTYTYLNFSNLPDVQRFVKTKVNSKKNLSTLWYQAYDGIVRMRNKPGFVYIFETSTGYQMIEQLYEAPEICDLNEFLFRSDSLLFMHLHRNSSYKEIMRLKILRILETGVHSKHRRLWVRTHLNCLNNNLSINVGMEYTAPLFIMLVCGYFMVLLLLMLEIFWKKWKLTRARR